MSTEFFNDQWRIPSNENQNKISNYSMDFDGSSAEIDLGISPVDLVGNSKPYSVSAWVYIAQSDLVSGTNYFIIGAFNPDRWYFRIMNSYVGFGYGNTVSNTSLTQITGDQWNHIVFTFDLTTHTIYINGVSKFTLSSSGQTISSNNAFIGALNGSSGSINRFKGKIDQVTIFDYALSASQVSTLYGGGTAITNPMALSPKPIAYYQLGDQSVSTGANYLVPNNSLSDYVFSFDGTSDSIDCGNDSSLDITGALSISFWIYGETNLAHKGIVSKCPSSGSIPTVAQYHIQYQSNNTLRFVLRNFDLYTGKETTGTVPTVDLNVWQHITMTWNGTNTMTVYKNGLPVCTKVQAITNVSNTSPVLLGLRAAGGFLNGQLSNTAIWNTELTSTQIETIYNNGSPNDISSLNPVSWWKLNAADTFNSSTSTWTINDYGSGGNDGTSSGMDSSNLVVSDLQQTSGYSPYALDFSGITAHLKTNTIPAQTNTVTLSAWVKRTGASGNIAGVFGVRNSGGSPNFGICWDLCFLSTTNKIEFRVSETDGSAYIQSTSNVALTDNTWTHVVGVADGTNVKLYINGVLQTDVESYNGTLRAPTSNILFAAQGYAGSNPFNGQLSNCARWNIGLTQAQVTEIFNSGRPSNLNTFSGTAPIGWWQLGSNSSFEGNDWTCLDEIGADYADSGTTAMSNDDIVDGVGYSGSGLGTSSIEIIGDAPYSTANGLSENMDVLDRTTDVPS